MKIQMFTNGRPEQTTAQLFAALASSFPKDVEVSIDSLDPPKHAFQKIARITKAQLSLAYKMLSRDALVIHSALFLSFIPICIARLQGKPTIALVWDIYPDSFPVAKAPLKRALFLLVKLLERLSYRLCSTLLVTTDDYLRAPALRHLKNIVVYPMWRVADNATIANVKLATRRSSVLKIIFAGQINAARGLEDSIEQLSHFFPNELVELDIYSDNPEYFDILLSLQHVNVSIRCFNYINKDDLNRKLNNYDFGLVPISRSFSLPAFPSKIMTYLCAGLPVLYFGPNMPGLEKIIKDNLGLVISPSSDYAPISSEAFAYSRRTFLENSSPSKAAERISLLIKRQLVKKS